MDQRFLSDIGARLKLSREKRGLSLEQVFEITRIQPAILKEIEEGQSALSPVLLKGFVKTYAETLGWDTKDFFKKASAQKEDKAPGPDKQKARDKKKRFALQYGLALGLVCLFMGLSLIIFWTGKRNSANSVNSAKKEGHSPLPAKQSAQFESAQAGQAEALPDSSAEAKPVGLGHDTMGHPAEPDLQPSADKPLEPAPLWQQIRRGDFTEEILIFSPQAMDIYFTADDKAVVTKALQPLTLFAIKARRKIYLRFDDNLQEVSVFHNGRFLPIPPGGFFERVFP